MALAYNPNTGFGTPPQTPQVQNPATTLPPPPPAAGAGTWQQPGNAYPQSPYPMPGQQAAQQPAAPQQSVGAQALSNHNPQNIQNYMTALNNVGAGSNNSFNASSAPAQGQSQNLYNNPAGGFNTNGGAVSYYGGMGGGQGIQQVPGGPTSQPQGMTFNPNLTNLNNFPPPGGGQGGAVYNQPPAYTLNSPISSNTNPTLLNSPFNTAPPPPQNVAAPPPANLVQQDPALLNSPFTNAPNPIDVNAPQQPFQNPQGLTPFTGNPYTGVADQSSNTNVANVVSDEDAKTNILDVEDKLGDFLGKLHAHSYEYKDPADGEGRYVSPMAQELEKSELGKSMVVQDQTGKKMVDYGRGFGFMLASQAYMNKRLNEIEKSFSLKRK